MNRRNSIYKNVLIIAIIAIIGYKIVDNYDVYLSIFKKLLSVLAPFFYAIIFAYILNPLMKFFQKKLKLKKGAAVGLTYLCILIVLFLIGFYGIPALVDSIISITKEIPDYVNTVQGWVNNALQNDKFYALMQDAGVLKTLTSISSKVGGVAITALEGAVGSLLSITTGVIQIGFGLLISIYLLLDKENFIKQIKLIVIMVLKEKWGITVINLFKTYNQMIGTYIGVKAIDSTIIGFISLIGLMIIKVPYAILLAIFVGFTNMIPYFGPFVGMVVCALVEVFVSPMKAIIVFIFLLAVQQFDAWYLEPKLVGNKVGIGPFWIILGVTIGGGFFGALGMLLASPTVATITIYYDRLVNKFKSKHEDVDDLINSL